MKFIKNTCKIFFITALLLSLAFFGCSDLFKGSSSSIQFKIDIPHTREISSTHYKMTVELISMDGKFSSNQARTVYPNTSEIFKFDDILIGSNIKIKAKITAEEKELYIGETDWQEVKTGTNKISLTLEKVYQAPEAQEPEEKPPVEIKNAAKPIIVVQPSSHTKQVDPNSNSDPSLSTTISIGAIVSDEGTLSFQWQEKTDSNWEPLEGLDVKIDVSDIGVNTSTLPITLDLNTSRVFRCIVTNTNENINGEKTAEIISDEVTVAYIEGTLSSISATYKSDSYELLGKDFNYSNVSVTETYTRSDNETTTITFTADNDRYTISPNTDSENPIGYVPYTVTYKGTTASLTVPVKYELDASNLVLETYFNSMHVSESDTDNAIKIPQYGTVKYKYDNDKLPSIFDKDGSNTEIKDINNTDYYTATIVDEKNQDIPNGSICDSDGSYKYTVTLQSANEWFVCNLNKSKVFSVKVCPWEIVLTTNAGSTVDTNNISLGTYTLSISNDAYTSISQDLPTFSCLVNDKNIITDKELTIDEDFITGTITASIIINEEYVEVASLKISITYAEGLTCAVQDDTVTLYISSAKGLATFRDIVNGTLKEDISVGYKDNSTSKHDFSAGISQLNINAVLETDIDLNNNLWTPIGIDSTNGYEGTFDGANHEIKNLYIISSDSNPKGLFLSVYGGTVKNLVVSGDIQSSGYTGGITGYLAKGTLQNCVNKTSITNSASIGTGGIVGYLANNTTTIENCINLAKISSSQSTVGGIVGTASSITGTSYANIKNCINLGEISGTSNISGIFGQSSATNVNISDCINLGKISANGTDFGYASGITTPSSNSSNYKVSNSINVGQVSATAETSSNSGAISSIPTNGTYTNNYYDSTVNPSVVDSSTTGITRKSTTELIGSNISLDGISADQWSFAEGRYPLPNIAESVPDGKNGEIWQTVIEAATPEVSSGGEGNATQSISTFSDLRSAITDANNSSSSYTLDNPCVIYIGNSFSTDDDTASTLTISTHVKLVANNTDGCTITKTSGYAGTNIFTVSSDASLTLGDETATGILTIDGAGVDVQSTKSLINVSGTLVLNEKSVLQNNICIDNYASSNGSAVYSDGGNIQIKGGEIKNNQILREKIYGGGIYLTNGTFEMTSGIFQGNSTDSSGKMYGGALYFSSCTVVITGGTFYNNSVTSTNTECCGGAIYIISSGTNDSPTQISNCTFTSNSAYQNGGAIYIGGTTCININNCTFNDNSVTNSNANGGAIYVANTSGGPVTILECDFTNNTANSSENTIYHDSSSSANISVTVDETAVANKSVWNPI